MKRLFLILLFIGSAVILQAQPGKVLKEANDLYASNEFAKAIKSYETLVSQGYESSELYFNLGNAYYKNGEITKAILYYEKAKLLAPNSEDIQFNLELANQFVVDKIEPLPQPFFVKWGQSILNLFSSNQWAIFSIFTFIGMLILAVVYIFARNISVKKISFAIAVLSITVSLITFILAGKQKSKITHHNEGIIFATTVTVKSSPDESGTDLFVIHEGLKAQIKQELGNWYEIRIADGNSGWIQKSAIEKI